MEARAIPAATSDAVAHFVAYDVICRHGCPKFIASDRGSIFLSDMFKQAMKLLGIKQQVSTFLRPQAQGLVEKSHDMICNALTMYVDSNQKNWPAHLQAIVFAYNSSIQLTTSFSPHFLLYGREPRLPLEADATITNSSTLEDIITNMNKAREIAREKIKCTQARHADYYNRNRQAVSFKVGDVVMLRKDKRKKGYSPKLFRYWYGPYEIKERISDVNFVLEAERRGKTYKETVHAEKLKHYIQRQPEEADAQENPEVESNDEDNVDTPQEPQILNLQPAETINTGSPSPAPPVVPEKPLYNFRARKPVNYRQ